MINTLKIKSSILGTACAFALSAPQLGFAGELSGKVNITSLRPYGVGLAYVQVTPIGVCGTDVFVIRLDEPGGKEMYSLALTAVSSGKRVELEVSNTTGCTGWGTRLQSMFIYS